MWVGGGGELASSLVKQLPFRTPGSDVNSPPSSEDLPSH